MNAESGQSWKTAAIRTSSCVLFFGDKMIDKKIVNKLFRLVDKSLKIDDVPVAAIIYCGKKIISCAYNKRNITNRTIDHAEILAILKANKKIKKWRLSNVCMITTLEPCEMCKTVIREARIENVYYLLPKYNYKKQYKCSNFREIEGLETEKKKYKECLSGFFANKR